MTLYLFNTSTKISEKQNFRPFDISSTRTEIQIAYHKLVDSKNMKEVKGSFLAYSDFDNPKKQIKHLFTIKK